MEGFLSLEQAAEQLDFSVSELARQIAEGRVVAIVKEGRSWLSAGEVSRLKRQSERSLQPAPAAPLEELRLLRRYPPEASKPANASAASPPQEPTALALRTAVDLSPASGSPDLGRADASSEPEAQVAPDVDAPVVVSEPSAPTTTAPSLSPKPELPAVPQTPERPSAPAPVAPGDEVEPPPPTPERPSAPAPVAPRGEVIAEASAVPSVPSVPSVPDGLPPTAVVSRSAQPAEPQPSSSDEKLAQQVRELNKRCAELEKRNLELEATANRLKSGLQETEATLKRNRAARSNLENDVIGLQDQLTKAKSRNEALEREVQRLGAEIERAEETHNSELRRLRSNKTERGSEDRDVSLSGSASLADLEALRAQTHEKDRLLAREYEQRATLRSQLEDQQQKYFELKARYDKEKTEWSELMAQAVQNQGQLRAQLEEMKVKSHPKGWNPFRREK